MLSFTYHFTNKKNKRFSLSIPPLIYEKVIQGNVVCFNNSHEPSLLTVRAHLPYHHKFHDGQTAGDASNDGQIADDVMDYQYTVSSISSEKKIGDFDMSTTYVGSRKRTLEDIYSIPNLSDKKCRYQSNLKLESVHSEYRTTRVVSPVISLSPKPNKTCSRQQRKCINFDATNTSANSNSGKLNLVAVVSSPHFRSSSLKRPLLEGVAPDPLRKKSRTQQWSTASLNSIQDFPEKQPPGEKPPAMCQILMIESDGSHYSGSKRKLKEVVSSDHKGKGKRSLYDKAESPLGKKCKIASHQSSSSVPTTFPVSFQNLSSGKLKRKLDDAFLPVFDGDPNNARLSMDAYPDMTHSSSNKTKWLFIDCECPASSKRTKYSESPILVVQAPSSDTCSASNQENEGEVASLKEPPKSP